MTLKRNALGEPIAVEIRCGVPQKKGAVCGALLATIAVALFPESLRKAPGAPWLRPAHPPSPNDPVWNRKPFPLGPVTTWDYDGWLTLRSCERHDGMVVRSGSGVRGPRLANEWASSTDGSAQLLIAKLREPYRKFLALGSTEVLYLPPPGREDYYCHLTASVTRAEAAELSNPPCE